MQVFIDSSTWLAYYLSDEPDHIRVKNIIKKSNKEGKIIVTSNDVIDETVTFLVYHKPQLVRKFIDFVQKAITTNALVQLWVDEEIQGQAFELVQKFSEHRLSLTDATTISLAKKFHIEAILTLDSDFTKLKAPVFPLY